jgi:hypothetical protein
VEAGLSALPYVHSRTHIWAVLTVHPPVVTAVGRRGSEKPEELAMFNKSEHALDLVLRRDSSQLGMDLSPVLTQNHCKVNPKLLFHIKEYIFFLMS